MNSENAFGNISQHSVEKKWICDICDKLFDSKNRLDSHSIWHQSPKWNCSKCDKAFQTNQKLGLHFEAMHTERKLKFHCDICGKSFVGKQGFTRHQGMHIDGQHQCGQCENKYANKYALKKHFIANHSGIKVELKCDVCEKVVSDKWKLKRHMEGVHKQITEHLKCNVCSDLFPNRDMLRRHTRHVHIMKKRYQCPQCDRVVASQQALNRHINCIHRGERQKCPQCDKTFAFTDTLRRHRQSVHLNLGCQCEICEQIFADQQGLKVHKESVHGNKSNIRKKCPICDNLYAGLSGLSTHIRQMHKDIKYECEICKEPFKNMVNLKDHQDTHLNQRFQCNTVQKIEPFSTPRRQRPRLVWRGRGYPYGTYGGYLSQK